MLLFTAPGKVIISRAPADMLAAIMYQVGAEESVLFLGPDEQQVLSEERVHIAIAYGDNSV
jgi:hypothetical protein